MGINFLDTKEKKQIRGLSKGEIMTPHADLKRFTQQVESKCITDVHFKKAYEKFKTPAYHTKGGKHDD